MSAINKGETYCCSLKDIKQFFGNTDTNLSFSYAEGSKFNPKHFAFGRKISKYVRDNISGKVVCHFLMGTRNADPWFSFHVMKESECSEELRQKFVAECLPKLYDFYQKHFNDQSILRKEYLMLIEFKDTMFIIHEFHTGRDIRN
jgi:hypothetical protein